MRISEMLFPKAELGNAQLPILDATEEAKLSILPAPSLTQSTTSILACQQDNLKKEI
jgi:hypothetical protein